MSETRNINVSIPIEIHLLVQKKLKAGIGAKRAAKGSLAALITQLLTEWLASQENKA